MALGSRRALPHFPTMQRADFLLAGAVCVLALGAYAVSGARPGLAGAPFEPRLAELRASDLNEASLDEHIALLRVVTRERPSDPQAWRFLAMALEASGQEGEAEFARAKAEWIAAEQAPPALAQPGLQPGSETDADTEADTDTDTDTDTDAGAAAPFAMDGDAP